MTLEEIFNELPLPSAQGGYSVERSRERYRVGRTHEGYPALLIAGGPRAHPFHFAVLQFISATSLEVASANDGTRLEELAVLRCKSTEPELVSFFFRIVSSTLIGDDRSMSEEGFEGALHAIGALFRALQQPAQMTIQGLWGELAIIAWSANPAAALTSWHSNARATHDFSAGNLLLEVKGSGTGRREHVFKLEQLEAYEEGHTLVASLLLGRPGDGLSILDLADLIKARINNPEAARRLDAGVVQCLGKDWRDGLSVRFDAQVARESVRFYLASDIPRVPQPLPPEVKGVHFTVDLSTTAPLELDSARSIGRFFADLLPADSVDAG